MNEARRLQGRLIGTADIDQIRRLIEQHPDWHRTRLSRHLCEVWAWRDATGRIKDMACRTLLLKLQRQGLIRLPAQVRPNGNPARSQRFQPALHGTTPIEGLLDPLRPIRLMVAEHGVPAALWQTLLSLHHYLGEQCDWSADYKFFSRCRWQNQQLFAPVRRPARAS